MVYISIILSAYNDAKTIRGGLESVIAQDNADMQMECVVVDDSSTDDTLAVIRRVVGGYSGNIRFASSATRPITAWHAPAILACSGRRGFMCSSSMPPTNCGQAVLTPTW